MLSKHPLSVILFASAAQLFSISAHSADVLFVSDSQTDTNIPAVLAADGHNVTTVLDDFTGGANAVLSGNLTAYDVVVWSETGAGSGSVHDAATATNLSNWVSGGGRLFVTGYDSIISPADPEIWGLLGGDGANDIGGVTSGPITSAANSLTTGLVDIRNVTPTGGHTADMDSLSVLAGTVCVVADNNNAGSCHWTLRTLGSGEIAYVSNGQSGPSSAHPSWADTSTGGAGAYNAGVRNFAFNAPGTAPSEPATIPTMSAYGLVLTVLGLLVVARRRLRVSAKRR